MGRTGVLHRTLNISTLPLATGSVLVTTSKALVSSSDALVPSSEPCYK